MLKNYRKKKSSKLEFSILECDITYFKKKTKNISV